MVRLPRSFASVLRARNPVKLACISVLFAIAAGCGQAAPSASSSQRPASAASTTIKTITVGVKTPPPFLYGQLMPSNTSAGGGPELADFVSSGFSAVDDRGQRIPQLGEAVPSIENGLWKVFPDGAMELTWRLKPNARWHDGKPLTSEDLAFTLQVGKDPEAPSLRSLLLEAVDGVTVLDERTLVTRWKSPFIDADELFSGVWAIPLPKHILGDVYATDPITLMDQPYFSSQFIGTGPFKLRSFEVGTGITLDAFADYPLGKPKVDVIEARFITDDNTLIAGVLAGSIDTILGPAISLEQALQMRDQWPNGKAEFKALSSHLVIYPQFYEPGSPIILNPQFRRALMSGINRPEMADSIQFGVVPIADSSISPKSPYYTAIESSIVRYPHDPQRAMRMIEELGYRRGSDGLFADASGNKLTVPVQVTRAQEIQVKTAMAVADYWRQIGVGTDMDIVAVQLAQDLAYRANFPGFAVQRQPTDVEALPKLHSTEARLAGKGYRGLNNARYMNAEMDALIDQYRTTVPIPARTQLIGQIIHRVTDEQIWMATFFDSEPSLISNRLVNVGPKSNDSIMTWNAHEWGVK